MLRYLMVKGVLPSWEIPPSVIAQNHLSSADFSRVWILPTTSQGQKWGLECVCSVGCLAIRLNFEAFLCWLPAWIRGKSLWSYCLKQDSRHLHAGSQFCLCSRPKVQAVNLKILSWLGNATVQSLTKILWRFYLATVVECFHNLVNNMSSPYGLEFHS